MLKEILHSPLLIFSVAFPIRYLIEGFLERRYCAHEFDRRAVIGGDLAAIFLFLAVFSPAAQYVGGKWGYRLPVSPQIDAVPFPLRIVMYLVVADFCHYWLHRLIHQPWLWRIHQWHHSPTHMSWMAGFRGTFFDATIINLAYVFAFPLLGTTSYRFQFLLLTFFSLKNDWMHLNVNWRFRWLEHFIVTPRYHHIHHSVDTNHHNKNLGVLFSIWDRLFGTYVDPDSVKGPIRFGTGENVPIVRLIAGV